MKKLGVVCATAVILYFGLLTYFAEHETVLKELFAAAAGLVVLTLIPISAVFPACSGRGKNFLAYIPFLICLGGLPAGFIGAIMVGESIKEANFKKNLPRYVELVRLIENGEIKPRYNVQIQLPDQYISLAYSVFTETNRNDRTITFLTDGAFPLWRAGYIYTSSGEIDAKTLKAWNLYGRVNSNWFYVSD